MVHAVPLELIGRVFPTSLITLDGQGIDVIIGMNWMKRHKTVLDISAHLIHLDSPIFGKVSLQLPFVACLHASIYTVITKSLDEVPVLWSMNIRMYFSMICWECLLIEPLNSKSSCSLALPLSISNHIQWC
jgi:uncharacterized membrane protein